MSIVLKPQLCQRQWCTAGDPGVPCRIICPLKAVCTPPDGADCWVGLLLFSRHCSTAILSGSEYFFGRPRPRREAALLVLRLAEEVGELDGRAVGVHQLTVAIGGGLADADLTKVVANGHRAVGERHRAGRGHRLEDGQLLPILDGLHKGGTGDGVGEGNRPRLQLIHQTEALGDGRQLGGGGGRGRLLRRGGGGDHCTVRRGVTDLLNFADGGRGRVGHGELVKGDGRKDDGGGGDVVRGGD
ncbi:hypothetical protein TYRP_010947 [Tyrophagus putrescentiae]|nr:hypothetical protein TYRP_010947 [Tyrophagus putrescentiae]